MTEVVVVLSFFVGGVFGVLVTCVIKSSGDRHG